MALVSLVDGDRQWFKSRVGLEISETPRDIAFCAHAILQDDLFVVPDAANDARFSDNPLVTSPPRIRFYAGMPLITATGHSLGTLCVMDRIPRELSAEQKDALRALARQVNAQIELRRDLAELERTHQELRAAQEELSAVMKAATQVSIIATDREGLIIVFNPGAERMLGYSAAEMIGKQRPRVWHIEAEVEERREELSRKLGRPLNDFDVFVEYARQGGYEEREWTFVRKDGGRLTVQLAVTPLRDASGGLSGFLGVATDITARKRAEAELIQARGAAEAASSAKSEFLAMMSHEIRTPMNAIIGMTELALDTRMTTEQRECLTTVRDAADSLLAMMNDVLDFSKIEARKLELHLADFSLRETLSDALGTFAIRAAQKGLEVALLVRPEVPERLRGDALRLRQILVNLASNAVKFTERGDVLVRVELEAESAPEVTLHFSVSDTGIGVPPEKQGLIYEAFAQADSSMSRKYGGTGLGLTIAAQLVDLMQGRMWLDSAAGRGSTFHFSVPFARGKGGQVSAVSAGVVLEGISVLAVDDSEMQRRVLSEILGAWKMDVSTADGGRTALALLDRAARSGHPIRLVVADAQMPEMDGLDLAAHVRAHAPLAGTRFVLISAPGQSGFSARGRELGILATLSKPVREAALREALEAALGAEPLAGVPPETGAPAASGEIAPPPVRRLRILLAEDNVINQRLILRLLEKQGHGVIVADNGLQALEAHNRESFDVILMDVQMPGRDGMETTRAIRERERRSGVHTPIIAVTAHALKEDRERCLAAGMDEYLSKPVRARVLLETIGRLAGEARPAAPATPPPVHSCDAGFDPAALLELVGGDEKLLREIAVLFLEDSPVKLAAIQRALAEGAAPALALAAHSIKGVLASFGVKSALAAAVGLEAIAKGGDLSSAQNTFESLQSEVARLQAAIRTWLIAGESAASGR